MTITRVGTNQKYAMGWDNAFGGKRTKSAPTAAAKKASPKKKGAAKKKAKK